MPEPIPFANLQSGHERLGGASPAAMNVCVDANGVLRRRPGIQTLTKAGTAVVDASGVDGVFATSIGDLYAVGASSPVRTVYRISGGSAAAVGGTPTMVGARRPTFAETEALVVVAAGDDLYRVVLATNQGGILSATAPKASHVIFNASRLLANDVVVDRSKVNFSGPAGSTVYTNHEVWGSTSISGFFSAEARPDPVQAIGENANEVFAWGATNLEIYGTDPLLTFGRITARDYGCVAPYSITRFDDKFVWLDHRRRFVATDGRSLDELSGDLGPLLDSMTTVEDCFGFRVAEGMMDALVFVFPTEGVTLAYQPGVGWGQWQSYAGGQWGAWPVLAHAHDPTTDTNIVGLSSGRVCQLQDGVVDDLGETIHAYVETGGVNRGTDAPKLCKRVRFTLERGRTTSDTEPVAFVQWADEPGQWVAPRPVGLGRGGQTNPVVTLTSLGTYRTRFWRFIFSEGEHMALVRAEEDFEVLPE